MNSGLRGRGGAGFPTGIKWRTVLAADAEQKYIVCNADEGDSGTYADRMIMEGDPFRSDRRHDHRRLRRRRDQRLHLRALRISARVPHAAPRHRHRLQQRLSRRERRRQRQDDSISKCASAPAPTSAAKRLPCSKASKASAARFAIKPPLPAISGLVRQAHGRQQRHLARHRADHSGQRRGVLSRFRHGQIARHADDSTRRQYQARRLGRKSVRPHACAKRFTISAAAPHPAARCAPFRSAGRWALISRNRCSIRRSIMRPSRRKKGHARPRRHRRFRRYGGPGAAGALRHGVLRGRKLRQVHALPHRLDPRRRSDRQNHRQRGSHAEIWNCSTIFAK